VTPEEIEALLRRAQAREEGGVVIRSFIAAYDSPYANCPEEIQEGDRAGYIGDETEASCWDCCEKAR
jgi:hypothetical protein